MKLPIKASLTTRDGFHKCIDIPELQQILLIPKMSNISAAVFLDTNSLPSPNLVSCETLTFRLERYKQVKQKKGLHHIVAVYKEI